jgi:hypothetical protein
VSPRLAFAIGLFVGLAPAMAQAQTNLDQGKTPAQIFANDCAACHKAARGLANGKNSSALADFLREHYTTSREQAAALAAYVLSGGGGIGTPALAHAPKMKPEPTTASAEEPKDREVKRPAKPDGDQGPAPKSQRPSGTSQKPDGANQKPEGTQTAIGGPGSAAPDRKPVLGPARSTAAPAGTRMGGQAKPAEASPAAPKPTSVAVVPSGPEGSGRGANSVLPEPSEALPSAEAPVPRDNIPD